MSADGAGRPGMDGLILFSHERFMAEALGQAERAFELNEVPIGAVVVHENRIIAKAYNQTHTLKDPTAHAEMIAITQAASVLQYERLLEAAVYSTVEPCVMCAGAMIQARIGRLYYAAPNEKYGACGSVVDLFSGGRWNHAIEVHRGLLAEEAGSLMRAFFRSKRTL